MSAPSVVFVSSHARHGGSERYLTTLLSFLPDEWVAKVILLETGPLVQELRALGVGTEVMRVSGARVDMALSLGRLRRLLKDSRADVVHANGIKAALLASLACAGGRPPVVWVKHDFSWDGPVGRLTALLCERVVGVSGAVVGSLPPRVRGKVSVVPIGIVVPEIDRDEARAAIRDELGLSEADSLVVHVGRLHPVKGHRALLEALGNEQLQGRSVHVAMAGGPDPAYPNYEAELRASIVYAGLGKRVHLLGHRPHVEQLIAGSDLVAITSGRDERGMGLESFSLVAIEAMAIGTPVVAFAAGGLPEVVGGCGRLVALGDVAGLARAIAESIEDERWRLDATRCGRRRVVERFDVTSMVEATQEILRSVATSQAKR